MVQVKRQLFTVEDYHKMAEAGIIKPTDRLELINGEIIKMSPVKSLHSSMVDDLYERLVLALHGKYLVKGQNPVRIATDSEPEPDLVVTKFREDKYRTSHPIPADILLLIEVSDTSLNFDREIKKTLYAEAGIPEYWIVNLEDKQVEIHRNPENGDYSQTYSCQAGDAATSDLIEFTVSVSDLF